MKKTLNVLLSVLTILTLSACAAGIHSRTMQSVAAAYPVEESTVQAAAETVREPETVPHKEDSVGTTVQSKDILTREQATELALEHAGVAKANVRFEKVELDLDDSHPEYEIESRVDHMEYDYEIHAQTGKILSAEKEYDD